MRNNLDFDSHIILAEASQSDASPEGLMVRHVFLKIADHDSQSLIINWNVVRIDAENLTPAFTPASRRLCSTLANA